MIKKLFLVVIMLMAFTVPAFAESEAPQAAQDPLAGARNTKYWLGSFEKYGDSSRLAGVRIQKIYAQDGNISYRLLVYDYIASYRGDMIPENGTVRVWNPSANDYVELEMPVVSYDKDGYGHFTYVFSLPNQVVECQRSNWNNLERGDEKRKAVLSFQAHNSVGHTVPYQCKNDFSFPMEYGM